MHEPLQEPIGQKKELISFWGNKQKLWKIRMKKKKKKHNYDHSFEKRLDSDKRKCVDT